MERTLLTTIQKSVLLVGLFLFVSLFSVQKSYGEAAINVGDEVKIKFGVLFQAQADFTQDPAYGNDYDQNLFLRRARFLVGGQLAPNLTFFTEFDNPNLGKQKANPGTPNSTDKNIQTSGFNTLDAVLTWKASEQFSLDTGLILVPLCRNCLEGAGVLMPIDYSQSGFVERAVLGTDIGRDTGVQARGYLLNDKLEIRVGAFQGFRETNGSVALGQTAPFRISARVQYDVFDSEKGLFYTGTYLGKKKVLAVGASYDAQADYREQAIDGFLDYPFGDMMALTAQVDYIRWMPGQLAGLADNADWVVEAGLYINSVKLQPFIQYEDQALVNSSEPATRIFQGGIGYYFAGYNGNLKLGAGYKDTGLAGGYANEITLQLQGFYF